MLPKTNRRILVFSVLALVMLFGALSLPVQASAVQVSEPVSNSCLTCHEDLYYLHDTGCWYCMSEPHKDRCTDCHAGNPSAVKEEEAHVGLLAHPQENGGAKCLECHTPEDAQMGMAKFESIQGFDTVIKAKSYVPSQPVKTGFPVTTEKNPFTDNLGWLAFGVLMFGVWLALVSRS